MPLTAFGKACQEHRRGMKAVIADQAAATDFSSALISKVERGIQDLPPSYLKKVIEWMCLEKEDAVELALLATLRKPVSRIRGENSVQGEESLASILDRFERRQTNTGIGNDEGKSSNSALCCKD